MAHSYRLEHFAAKKPLPPAPPEIERAKRRLGSARKPEQKIHYGKRFAETEDLLAAKVMTHQLEELAGVQSTSAAPTQPAPTFAKAVGGQASPPIGALPATAEPPVSARWGELLDEAERNMRIVSGATRDIVLAGYRLVRLPIRAAQLAAQRMVTLEP